MSLNGKRIFYIEDNVANRAIIQTILELDGAQVAFERWGRSEVIGQLRAFMPVDIILLDLMFPRGVTGYDVFDTIRACPEFAHIPIVAVSASDPSVEIPKARARGFAGFISKPISLADFPHQVASLITGDQIWA
jgi:CheY-like chemotaxis protein